MNARDRKVPDRIRRRVQEITDRLLTGADYREFKGKRMHFDRSVISIPIGRDWRLICIDDGAGIQPREVMTHEKYNREKRWKKN